MLKTFKVTLHLVNGVEAETQRRRRMEDGSLSKE